MFPNPHIAVLLSLMFSNPFKPLFQASRRSLSVNSYVRSRISCPQLSSLLRWGATGLDGQNIIDHLWACASDALARRCYEAGNCDKITEKILLQRMKKMSIRVQNKLVNIVEFLSMTQDKDEPVAQFVSIAWPGKGLQFRHKMHIRVLHRRRK